MRIFERMVRKYQIRETVEPGHVPEVKDFTGKFRTDDRLNNGRNCPARRYGALQGSWCVTSW